MMAKNQNASHNPEYGTVEQVAKPRSITVEATSTSAEIDQRIADVAEKLGDVSAEEIAKNPKLLQQAMRAVLAVVLAWSVVPTSREVKATIPVERQSVATETSTESAVDYQKVVEEFEIAKEIAEATDENGTDLASLDDIEETAFNRPFLRAARRFVAVNEEKHLRGEDRHSSVERYLEEGFQKIAEVKRSEKVSGGQVRQAEEIFQAGFYDVGEQVRAGYAGDILRAAKKAGMVSPESSREVMKLLFDDERSFEIDLEKQTIKVAGGETRTITDRAVMRQIIGNAEIQMPNAFNQGVMVEGAYDIDEVDPEQGEKLRRDPELIDTLVKASWPEIKQRLMEAGVDTNSNELQLYAEVVNALKTGQERSFSLGLADSSPVSVDAGDLSNISFASEVSASIEGYFAEYGVRPEISVIPDETEMQGVVAKVSANLELTGGRIGDEQLCRGNFLIIAEIGNLIITIDKHTLDQVREKGMVVIFDRLEAVLPAALGGEETGIKNEFAENEGNPVYLEPERKDLKYRTTSKSKTWDFQGSQTARGISSAVTGSRVEKRISVGRGGGERNPKGHGRRGNHNVHR